MCGCSAGHGFAFRAACLVELADGVGGYLGWVVGGHVFDDFDETGEAGVAPGAMEILDLGLSAF